MIRRVYAFKWKHNDEVVLSRMSKHRKTIEVDWALELRMGWGCIVWFQYRGGSL